MGADYILNKRLPSRCQDGVTPYLLRSRFFCAAWDVGLGMKVSEVIGMLHQDGWYLRSTRGSHRQFKHLMKRGRVTVPGKPSDDWHLGRSTVS